MPNMYEMMDWNFNINDTDQEYEQELASKFGTCSRCNSAKDECGACDCTYEDCAEPFWKVIGQESYGNGYIATHIEWPSDRLICMKDGEGDKHILIPVFDVRQVGNSRQEMVDLLIEDNKKQVHGNLKYIYTFSIQGYDHLFGMVALSRESEPVTDFFKNIEPLRECTESCFKSY